MKRKMQLRTLTNDELFRQYDGELVHHHWYRTRQETIGDITEYIEILYNRQRQQARLGLLSPVVYEQRYYAGLLAA